MTTLPERLQDVIAEMRRATEHDARFGKGDIAAIYVTQWADRLEAVQALQAAPEGGEVCIVCDWKDADPFPRFIEAEVGGRSVAFEWRYRNDGLKELVIPTQGETK